MWHVKYILSYNIFGKNINMFLFTLFYYSLYIIFTLITCVASPFILILFMGLLLFKMFILGIFR
ncbi:hypothetical protein F-VV10_0271 [Faustovirus]|nr:hypothetical protein F-VV10_0271 [Faustovirus]